MTTTAASRPVVRPEIMERVRALRAEQAEPPALTPSQRALIRLTFADALPRRR